MNFDTDEGETFWVFCDGSGQANGKPGGWASIISFHGKVRELGEYQDDTSSNRMEMTAALKGLEALPDDPGAHITLFTDSMYVIRGMRHWIRGWRASGWMTGTGEPVKNQDLWERLDKINQEKRVTWVHVKGHVGIRGNERCDEIAGAMRKKEPMDLFEGPYEEYFVDLSNLDRQEKKIRVKPTP